MADIVQLSLPPKRLFGKKRNVSWEIEYVPKTKLWKWTVTIIMSPQKFTGASPTQALAQKEIDKYLRQT